MPIISLAAASAALACVASAYAPPQVVEGAVARRLLRDEGFGLGLLSVAVRPGGSLLLADAGPDFGSTDEANGRLLSLGLDGTLDVLADGLFSPFFAVERHDGTLFATDSDLTSGFVSRTAPGGSPQRLADGPLGFPYALAIDPADSGSLIVSEFGQSPLFPAGVFGLVRVDGETGEASVFFGGGTGEIFFALDLAPLPSGGLLVVNGDSNLGVLQDGVFTPAPGDGSIAEFFLYADVSPAGTVFAADYGVSFFGALVRVSPALDAAEILATAAANESLLDVAAIAETKLATIIFATDAVEVYLIDLCPADTTGDGAVTFGDVSRFIADFNAGAADLNGDGATSFGDVSFFIGAFNSGCP